ncbi:MAG: nucleoside deaminase [Phycisphaeraceae bacterium]
MQTHFEFELPAWVEGFVTERGGNHSSLEQRMALAIALSAENIARQTGGPFGAAIFDQHNQLVSVGVNLVPSQNCSILHAEMVAIALAQKTLGRYDLSDGGAARYELVSSAEPCAMCMGAVPWSGIKRLVCGARDEDVRTVGFDEGAKLSEWFEALNERGIEVTRDVRRAAAKAVLDDYATRRGTIY